ncbi:DUF4116 domain-containing protein [Thermophilibacter sp.]
MGDGLVVQKSSLIERLDSKPGVIGSDNPFYWYIHLKSLGKRAQTKEMVDEAVNGFSVDNHAYTILKVIAKKYLTREVCEIAVRKNGLNLKYVPEQYRDTSMCMSAVQSDGGALRDVPAQILLGDKGYEICYTAVCNDFEGQALSLVPDCCLRGKEGKALCEAAVRANGYALEYVPKRLITKELARTAIETPFPVKEILLPDGSRLARSAYRSYCPVLSFVPEKCMSEELVALSARLYPESLRYAPAEFVSRDLCLEVVERDPMNLQYVPMPDKKLVDSALQANPRAILAVPESMLTLKRCRDALRRDPTIPIEKLPEGYRKKLEKEFRSDTFVKYEPIALETPALSNGDKRAISQADESHTYELTSTDDSAKTIYYITDIHLEHQLVKKPGDIVKLSLPEIRERIDNKIAELLASVPDAWGTLLIGGDVADSVELETLFYERLTSLTEHHGRWYGDIFSVLGNHELWDGDPMGLKPARPVDEIIADYRQAVLDKVTLLENELFIVYKGFRKAVLDEKAILNASVEELTEACSNSTFLLLGGIGFSGLNPVYNAEMGLYRATVSTEEDIARSKRFRAVYEKVLASAKDIPVIVLTHTQMADWSDAQYNPKWIYVSGHTHQNTFLLQSDGTSVFSDNQVGYKPKPWHLNAFTIDVHRYDPFKDYPDGIHQITRDQYVEFNRCQGIMMQGMKYPGDLYVLKCDGVYMFVLESTSSLCLLEGGRRHKLDYDVNYYYDNLPDYIRKVRGAFAPYQKALSMVSDEVKALGGSGCVHGCIVDIDWFNHVYLNPFDGKVTPYFALNTTDKLVFKDMESLLESSPCPPLLHDGESMVVRFYAMDAEGKLPVLSRKANKKWELATVPQVVLDRSMYEPSRIMRSIQYIFDRNVLRVWNEAVLAVDDHEGSQTLPGTSKLLGS